jgi:hypothetical protein
LNRAAAVFFFGSIVQEDLLSAQIEIWTEKGGKDEREDGYRDRFEIHSVVTPGDMRNGQHGGMIHPEGVDRALVALCLGVSYTITFLLAQSKNSERDLGGKRKDRYRGRFDNHSFTQL